MQLHPSNRLSCPAAALLFVALAGSTTLIACVAEEPTDSSVIAIRATADSEVFQGSISAFDTSVRLTVEVENQGLDDILSVGASSVELRAGADTVASGLSLTVDLGGPGVMPPIVPGENRRLVLQGFASTLQLCSLEVFQNETFPLTGRLALTAVIDIAGRDPALVDLDVDVSCHITD